MHRSLKLLVPAVLALSIVAALAGLLPGEGAPYAATSLRGESVTVNGRGLYRWDTLSSAAQMQANDLVTLALVVPLMALSFAFALRGSLRGRLLLTGAMGFILYTYTTMVFGAHYNALFLVYVALFSLSLFAFILLFSGFDAEARARLGAAELPRKAIAGLLFFAALFLSVAWLGRVAATFRAEAAPALENTTSMFIQAMDLGIVVPVCVLAGILVLRRRPFGALLASIGLVKFSSLGLAVSLMGLNMSRLGVPISLPELGIFLGMAAAGLLVTLWTFARLPAGKSEPSARSAR